MIKDNDDELICKGDIVVSLLIIIWDVELNFQPETIDVSLGNVGCDTQNTVVSLVALDSWKMTKVSNNKGTYIIGENSN